VRPLGLKGGGGPKRRADDVLGYWKLNETGSKQRHDVQLRARGLCKWGRVEDISYVAQRKDGAAVDHSATRQTLANAEIDGKQHNVLSAP